METSDGRAIILDSSIWIAYLHQEDSQHTKAIRVVAGLSNTVIVPSDVLGEVATTLKNKKRDDLAKDFVRDVVSGDSALLVLDNMALHHAIEVFLARTDRLSFIDTVLLTLSKRYRILTFDRSLYKAITEKKSSIPA